MVSRPLSSVHRLSSVSVRPSISLSLYIYTYMYICVHNTPTFKQNGICFRSESRPHLQAKWGPALSKMVAPCSSQKGPGLLMARGARLVRERVRAGHGVMKRPLYIGIRIHICMYTHGERQDRREERRGRRTEGERRPAITSTSGGAPPRAERSHPAGMERARIQEEPRWRTRAFDGDGVL